MAQQSNKGLQTQTDQRKNFNGLLIAVKGVSIYSQELAITQSTSDTGFTQSTSDTGLDLLKNSDEFLSQQIISVS